MGCKKPNTTPDPSYSCGEAKALGLHILLPFVLEKVCQVHEQAEKPVHLVLLADQVFSGYQKHLLNLSKQ
jgi:hypothetical protein